ncbi:hypothetical protein KGF57_001319 [Candida theae]|uniref:GATA-type domain-containing protein n=1 Tax=Candida theae TaxID=1198502 RepID=A0AAD5BHT7_9ASCO|nr:uncharacterized protein KGF57_001319 [Candida theae]KAI5963374.1 hypothetical protein KGF57_001319 [Candida theae]
MPRLPSFRQLNETLKETEFVSPAQRVVQYSSSARNLATNDESQATPQNKLTNTPPSGRSLTKGQEYMYGAPLYGRHDSYPNQYYISKNETSLPSYSTSPSSIESLDMSKVDQDLSNQHKEVDYQFVSELLKFLLDFESKCKEMSVLSYYTYGNTDRTFENIVQRMKYNDVDQVLNNLRKVSDLLESIKRHKHKKQHFMGPKVARASDVDSGNSLKRHLSQHVLTSMESKKSRRKSMKLEHHLTGCDLLQHNAGVVPNDACLYFESKNNLNAARIDSDATHKPEIICQHCRSKETPEWRRGPEGSRTLCNACGLFYSKLIKKYGLHEADRIMLERKQTGSVNDRRIF